jgi:hypothetical protein
VYSSSVYNFTPKYQVVLFEGDSPRRYQIVYAKNLTLNKGVDNKIQFQFLNQEQKPIDLTGKEITFRFINSEGTSVDIQKTVNVTLPLKGLANLTVTQAELMQIDAQLGSFSLDIVEGNLTLPIFSNSEADARGVCQVMDSILPKHVPSTRVTIPSHGEVSNSGTTYYSSVLGLNGSSKITLQASLSNYSGNINVLGSTTVDADWYTIESLGNFTAETNTLGTTITGFHPYIQLQFTSTGGTIAHILAR